MSPVPTPKTERSRVLLSEGVRRRILGATLDGTLVAGERLHDDELIAWLGVSRTPIRTALERLAELGIVEMEPNRYTRVSCPTPRSLLEALQVYSAVHSSAAEGAVPRLDPLAQETLQARFGELRRLSGRGEGYVWARSDIELVDVAVGTFAALCQNSLLRGILYEIQVRLAFSFHSLAVPIDPVALDRFVDRVLTGCAETDGIAVSRALADYLGLGVLEPLGDGGGP